MYYLASHGTQALPTQDLGKSAQACHDLGGCRTIWDIIWSCVVTIFACTWLAIHPNIPARNEGLGWRALRHVGIFITAVIAPAPELIIYWAMKQWMAARELKKKYKNFKWTLTHGFFAIMGGFMIYEDDTPQFILDPWELEEYLISGQIRITEDEIRDKSKGDVLTKGLVVFQTTWFILQLIARAIKHLPITELEVATLAFASLNFITYSVWWNKPLNVELPVRVYSHTGHHKGTIEDATEKSGNGVEMRYGSADLESLNLVRNSTSGEEGSDMRGSTNQKKHRSKFFKTIQDVFRPPSDSFVSEEWHNTSLLEALLFPFFLMAGPVHNPSMLKGEAKRVPTFYSGRMNDVVDNPDACTIFAMTVVTVLFDGIHCIAWVFHFPTRAEQLIWRVSSIFITTSPTATLVLKFIADTAQLRFGLSDGVCDFFFGVSTIITMVFYPLARLATLVQALTTLRSLPSDAYTTVQWTTFIPHI